MTGNFVYIPVPAARVREVYALLSDEPPQAGKPEADLSRDLLKRMYTESEPNHRALMRVLAESPDTWLSTKDLGKRLEARTARQMSGMLGAFGRRSKNRY